MLLRKSERWYLYLIGSQLSFQASYSSFLLSDLATFLTVSQVKIYSHREVVLVSFSVFTALC